MITVRSYPCKESSWNTRKVSNCEAEMEESIQSIKTLHLEGIVGVDVTSVLVSMDLLFSLTP
jgi:hypothetical protein